MISWQTVNPAYICIYICCVCLQSCNILNKWWLPDKHQLCGSLINTTKFDYDLKRFVGANILPETITQRVIPDYPLFVEMVGSNIKKCTQHHIHQSTMPTSQASLWNCQPSLYSMSQTDTCLKSGNIPKQRVARFTSSLNQPYDIWLTQERGFVEQSTLH